MPGGNLCCRYASEVGFVSVRFTAHSTRGITSVASVVAAERNRDAEKATRSACLLGASVD